VADKLSPERRSENMRRIKSKGMKPELAVRSLVHSLGYRFWLHRRDLPGKPDLVFPKYRKVVFVHGCFWHQHPGCREGRLPSSNRGYWEEKLRRNQERDAKQIEQLKTMGWEVMVIWECEAKNAEELINKLRLFLNGDHTK
jgi:DNA mismatch endonuclease, patch repair protein